VSLETSPLRSANSFAPTASVSEKEISRVLPRMSFRLMLTVVTIAAGIAFTFRQASAGSSLAAAIIYSLLAVALSFALFAVLFLIAWIPAVIGKDRFEDVNRGNPFSNDQLPPQVLPPRDPGT
jgi:hypothetical protein